MTPNAPISTAHRSPPPVPRNPRFVPAGDPGTAQLAPTFLSTTAAAPSGNHPQAVRRAALAVDSLLRTSYSDAVLPPPVRAAVVAGTVAKFKAYERHFDRFTSDQGGYTLIDLFNRLDPQVVAVLMREQRTMSRLSEGDTQRALVERDVKNIATFARYSARNKAMTGYERSVFLSDDPLAARLRGPGGLVSRLNTHLFRIGPNDHRFLKTISIAAPAFDSVQQPEYRDYIDENGRLKPEMMVRRFEEINEHLLGHFALNPFLERGILAGAGAGAFLHQLSPQDKEVALEIQADAWAKLTVDLRAMGRDVAYSDKAPTSKLWDRVNAKLSPNPRIVNLGKAPGPWMKGSDALLMCHDNAALEGNECRPESQEGALGAASTMHVVDLLRCALTSSLAEHGIQRSPFVGRNVMSPDSHEVVNRIALAKDRQAAAATPPAALTTYF